MKNIISLIVLILLFVVSVLVFWAGLSPNTFSDFFAKYPEVSKTVNQIGIVSNKNIDLSEATSSQPISGTDGQILINNNTWNVKIARDQKDQVSGLSNRKTLRMGDGLLFAFEKMSPQSFWMKDMLIPIDMVFFDNNWRVVLIESNIQPGSFPKTFGGGVKSQYVLEINANEAISYDLKVGDRAIFINK
jgi:hypothetical protein